MPTKSQWLGFLRDSQKQELQAHSGVQPHCQGTCQGTQAQTQTKQWSVPRSCNSGKQQTDPQLHGTRGKGHAKSLACRRHAAKSVLSQQLQLCELPSDRGSMTKCSTSPCVCCKAEQHHTLSMHDLAAVTPNALQRSPCCWLVMLHCNAAQLQQHGSAAASRMLTNPHFIFDSLNSTRLLTTGSYLTRCSL